MSRNELRETGSIVVVAMLAMVALISLGGLTTLSVRGGLAAGGHDRFTAVALYAAESGAAVAVDFLRSRAHEDENWSDFVLAYDPADLIPEEREKPFFTDLIPGNGVQPGDAGNLFGSDVKAWYNVVILNNRDDQEITAGEDSDKRVVIRSTGYGPSGTIAQVELEVQIEGAIGNLVPPCAYSQESQCATNDGNVRERDVISNPGDQNRSTPSQL
ncbi:MAG: hypothetical protein MJE77_05175 [Proteobacteria bacterium]|nr:hypothetical protein [Pseudomonadota bacterium]